VPTYDTDQGTRLNWQQVKEMQAAGLTIASHSYHHERATEMTGRTFADEIKKSQAELKEQLDITNEYFCYPYGGYTKSAGDALKAAGIKLAFYHGSGLGQIRGQPLCGQAHLDRQCRRYRKLQAARHDTAV
jgi:peptidoglycan/xylan/chitin deacetylase (PgdA/CDA1 family)